MSDAKFNGLTDRTTAIPPPLAPHGTAGRAGRRMHQWLSLVVSVCIRGVRAVAAVRVAHDLSERQLQDIGLSRADSGTPPERARRSLMLHAAYGVAPDAQNLRVRATTRD